MRARLRALERALVCQRAYVLVEPVAMDFIDAWEQAMDAQAPLPDELDLVRAVATQGVPILTLTPLTSYLAQCRRGQLRRLPTTAQGALVRRPKAMSSSASTHLKNPHRLSHRAGQPARPCAERFSRSGRRPRDRARALTCRHRPSCHIARARCGCTRAAAAACDMLRAESSLSSRHQGGTP